MIPLSDLIVYQLAMDLGESAWNIVGKWGEFERRTVGIQFVRSADSVAANIAEGHGRFHYGDRKQFGYYARASLYETETWIRKSTNRHLILPQQVKELDRATGKLGRMLNGYIRSIRLTADKK